MPSTPLKRISGRIDPLASWDAKRQQQHAIHVHILLDMSGSMYGARQELIMAYNRLLSRLQTWTRPTTVLDCQFFQWESETFYTGALHQAPMLTEYRYCPDGGTRMKTAIAALLDAQEGKAGTHILIVFTDGQDDATAEEGNVPATTIATQLSNHPSWLFVYLGAYPDAMEEGLRCGFREGNCLTFDKAHLADAFRLLQQGMQRFLTADNTVKQRLLTAGIFSQ